YWKETAFGYLMNTSRDMFLFLVEHFGVNREILLYSGCNLLAVIAIHDAFWLLRACVDKYRFGKQQIRTNPSLGIGAEGFGRHQVSCFETILIRLSRKIVPS